MKKSVAIIVVPILALALVLLWTESLMAGSAPSQAEGPLGQALSPRSGQLGNLGWLPPARDGIVIGPTLGRARH